MRIKFLKREKAAYLILRRKGLSINAISKAFGRSTSVIHSILVKAQKHGYNLDVWKRPLDLRKIPFKARMRMSSYRRSVLEKLRQGWEQWILGEGERPP